MRREDEGESGLVYGAIEIMGRVIAAGMMGRVMLEMDLMVLVKKMMSKMVDVDVDDDDEYVC